MGGQGTATAGWLSDVQLSEAHLHWPSLLHTPFHDHDTVWLLFYFQWTLPRAPWEHGPPKQPGDTQPSQATDTRKLTLLESMPPHCHWWS